MKYFRVFETESNYTDFVNGSDFWSSSEHSYNDAYYLGTYNGSVYYYGKDYYIYVRPFSILYY